MYDAWKSAQPLPSFLHGWENWSGSHYGLAVAYPHTSLDPSTRLRMLRTLWRDSRLRGVVQSPEHYGTPWKTPERSDVNAHAHVYGCFRLRSGQVVGCQSFFSPEGEALFWLIVDFSLGQLGHVYPVNYTHSITHTGNPWTLQVDEELAALGMSLYRQFPFLLGIMGEEVPGLPLERVIAELAQDRQALVPEALFQQLQVQPFGTRSPEGLWWTGSLHP